MNQGSCYYRVSCLYPEKWLRASPWCSKSRLPSAQEPEQMPCFAIFVQDLSTASIVNYITITTSSSTLARNSYSAQCVAYRSSRKSVCLVTFRDHADVVFANTWCQPRAFDLFRHTIRIVHKPWQELFTLRFADNNIVFTLPLQQNENLDSIVLSCQFLWFFCNAVNQSRLWVVF